MHCLLQLLLQHGASIVTNDSEGLTPAMWACHFEQLQNLLLLKSALVRTDPRDDALYEETDLKGRTVVHWAVNKTGSIECLTVSSRKCRGPYVQDHSNPVVPSCIPNL